MALFKKEVLNAYYKKIFSAIAISLILIPCISFGGEHWTPTHTKLIKEILDGKTTTTWNINIASGVIQKCLIFDKERHKEALEILGQLLYKPSTPKSLKTDITNMLVRIGVTASPEQVYFDPGAFKENRPKQPPTFKAPEYASQDRSEPYSAYGGTIDKEAWKPTHTTLVRKILNNTKPRTNYDINVATPIIQKILRFDATKNQEAFDILVQLLSKSYIPQEFKGHISNMLDRTGATNSSRQKNFEPSVIKQRTPKQPITFKDSEDNPEQYGAYGGAYGGAHGGGSSRKSPPPPYSIYDKDKTTLKTRPQEDTSPYLDHLAHTAMMLLQRENRDVTSETQNYTCELKDRKPPSYEESIRTGNPSSHKPSDFTDYKGSSGAVTRPPGLAKSHQAVITSNTGFYTKNNNCALAALMSILLPTDQFETIREFDLLKNWPRKTLPIYDRLRPVVHDSSLDSIRELLGLSDQTRMGMSRNDTLSIDQVLNALQGSFLDFSMSIVNLIESDENTPLNVLPFIDGNHEKMHRMEEHIKYAVNQQLGTNHLKNSIGIQIQAGDYDLPIPPSVSINNKRFFLASMLFWSDIHFYSIIRDPDPAALDKTDADFYYMDSGALLQDAPDNNGLPISTSLLVKLPKLGNAIKSNTWGDYGNNLLFSETSAFGENKTKAPWSREQFEFVKSNISKRISQTNSKPILLIYQAR